MHNGGLMARLHAQHILFVFMPSMSSFADASSGGSLCPRLGQFHDGTACQPCPAGRIDAPGLPINACAFPPLTGPVVYSQISSMPVCVPALAALDNTDHMTWCAYINPRNAIIGELIIDAGAVGYIEALITRGGGTVWQGPGNEWVTRFNLSHSRDAATWTFVGSLPGNTDPIDPVTRTLRIVTRYLRIAPTEYNNYPFMRAGILPFTDAACRPGTFSNALGATACLNCSAGAVAPAFGATACASCAPGTFAPNSTVCQPCPPGAFGANAGATACALCPRNSFAAAPGSTACAPCQNNTLTVAPGATACGVACGFFGAPPLPCPLHSFCPDA